jgi:hypothetical protein
MHMEADDAFVPCSQLDERMDVYRDVGQQEATHIEVPAPTDEPQVHFVCSCGTNRGAMPSFSLPAVHRAKIYLGCLAPPQPRSKYATVEPEKKVVLTNSHHHGISRTAGYLEYNQHKGVLLANTQGAGLPMFVDGELIKAFGDVVLQSSDGLELGFGGSSSDAVTPTTVVYRARFINMPPLVDETMPPPPSMPLGKRPTNGAGGGAPKQGRKDEPPPSFTSDDERRVCAQALDITKLGYDELYAVVFGPQDERRTRLERLISIQQAMISKFEELQEELSSAGAPEGAEASEEGARSQDASQSQVASQSQQEQWRYGAVTQEINADLREFEQQDPQMAMPNDVLRDYAYAKYRENGYSEETIRLHMNHRTAGHIVAKSRGGGETVANKMWEDKRANHAHGARPVNAAAAARANRFSPGERGA